MLTENLASKGGGSAVYALITYMVMFEEQQKAENNIPNGIRFMG